MEIRDALAFERETKAETTYLSLFATPENRKRMRIIIGAYAYLLASSSLARGTKLNRSNGGKWK